MLAKVIIKTYEKYIYPVKRPLLIRPSSISGLLRDTIRDYLLPFTRFTIFIMRPAKRLRLTRIINEEENKVAMEIKALFTLNEIMRV